MTLRFRDSNLMPIVIKTLRHHLCMAVLHHYALLCLLVSYEWLHGVLIYSMLLHSYVRHRSCRLVMTADCMVSFGAKELQWLFSPTTFHFLMRSVRDKMTLKPFVNMEIIQLWKIIPPIFEFHFRCDQNLFSGKQIQHGDDAWSSKLWRTLPLF